MNHKGKTLHIQPKDEKDGKLFTIYLIYKYGQTQIYNNTPTQEKKKRNICSNQIYNSENSRTKTQNDICNECDEQKNMHS